MRCWSWTWTCVFLAGLVTLTGPHALGQEEDVQLRLDEVELGSFLEFLSRQSGLNLLMPKDRSGLEKEKVTVFFAARVPESAVLEIAIAILRIHGYSLVPVTGQERTFKVVQASSLATEPVPYLARPDPGVLSGPDQFVSQLIRLEHIRSTDLVAALRQGKVVDESRASLIEVKDQNALVLSDYASNIRRVLAMVATLDVAPPGTDIVSVPVEHVRPSEVLERIREFETKRAESSRGAEGQGARGPMIYADDGGGRLVVEGTAAEIERVKKLLAVFDIEPVATRREHLVYRVRHLDFKTLQPLVDQILLQNFPADAEGGTTRVTVVGNETGASFIFTGERRDLEAVEGLLTSIDLRQPQILIETAIIQLSGSDSLQLGIELQTMDPVGKEGSIRGFANSQFGLSTLVDEVGRPLTGPGIPGGRLPGQGQGLTTFLTKDQDIPVLLRAIQTRAQTEVLSSPRLVLADNTKGSIKIAQEEPVTSTVALSSNATQVTFNGFVSAGTVLDVTPHIAPGGEVRLELEQSIDDFNGQGLGGIPPAKTTRSLKTTIRLTSGQTVVLGGFNGKREIDVVDQIPVLGDIPLLGYLFRSTSKATEVTKIYILVRPVILDQEGAPSLGEQATEDRDRMEEDVHQRPLSGEE